VIPFGPLAVTALLALPPGWLYLKVAGRRRPQGRAGGLSELLDLAGAGTGALAAGITVCGAGSLWWSPPFLDVRDWLAAADRSRYVDQHVPEALFSSAVAFLASITAAIFLALIFTRGTRTQFHSPASLAMHALGKRPKGQQPWVWIERDDDTAIEGLLLGYSYNMDPAGAGVDVAVRRPIYVTPPGRSPERRDLDRALVPGKRIRTGSRVPSPDRFWLMAAAPKSRLTRPAPATGPSPAGWWPCASSLAARPGPSRPSGPRRCPC
jgi:hypothetical protein